jgi:dienelactone hydrolase
MREIPVLMALAFAVAVLSCADDDQTESITAQPATTESGAATAELVASDVAYHDDTSLERWVPPLLDVYAPPGAEGLPVVVMFHGGSGNLTKAYLADLAQRTAAAGAVVFVPTHGSSGGLEPVAEDAAPVARVEVDAAACAVAYAMATAEDLGGDPEQLVIFGHSWGGTVGTTVALRGPNPFPACVVEPAPFDVDGLVAWDGDYLMAGSSMFDTTWGTEVPVVMAEITPWPWIDTDDPPTTVILTSANSPDEGYRRELPDNTGDWLAVRDPDGTHTARLETLGALDDDQVDVNEEAELLVDTMQDSSFDVELIVLAESGHEWGSVSTNDRAILIDAILGTVGQ